MNHHQSVSFSIEYGSKTVLAQTLAETVISWLLCVFFSLWKAIHYEICTELRISKHVWPSDLVSKCQSYSMFTYRQRQWCTLYILKTSMYIYVHCVHYKQNQPRDLFRPPIISLLKRGAYLCTTWELLVAKSLSLMSRNGNILNIDRICFDYES